LGVVKLGSIEIAVVEAGKICPKFSGEKEDRREPHGPSLRGMLDNGTDPLGPRASHICMPTVTASWNQETSSDSLRKRGQVKGRKSSGVWEAGMGSLVGGKRVKKESHISASSLDKVE